MQNKPPHPGVVIGAILQQFNVSIADAAKDAGLQLHELQNIVDGRSPITASTAEKLETLPIGGMAQT
jgi:plasmid maintenance system antidote protein VapI